MEKFTIGKGLLFLQKYIRPYRKHFAAFYGGWLVETIIAVLLPKLLGIMLDEIVYRQDVAEFMKVSGIAAIISIYSCILYYWLYAQHHYLMIMFTFHIKVDVFEKFMKIEPLRLKRFRTGEVIALIQEYPAECMHFLIRGVIHQINNFVIIAAVLVFSFRLSAVAGAAMAMLSGLCGIVTFCAGKSSGRASVRQRDEYGRYIGWLYEILENSVTVKLLGAQDLIRAKFERYSEKLFREKDRMSITKSLSGQVIKGVFLIARLAVLGTAVYMTAKDSLTIGSFTVIITYFNKLTGTLTDINQKWTDAQTRAGYIKKLHEFMECPDEEDTGKLVMEHCRGDIRIRNMKFSYGEKEVFRNFNLHITFGEKVAVTGASGSGKSTLAELMTGMLKPERGTIQIDGNRIEEYTLRSLRSRIGILWQDALIIEGSLKDNLLLADSRASDRQMWRALWESELGDYAERLENGIDTVISGTLSGGQKQRLAIAQLCLRNPDIIIFDEPTAALDDETEYRLIEHWRKLFKDKTLIVITHRPKPLELCDRVIRVEKEK